VVVALFRRQVFAVQLPPVAEQSVALAPPDEYSAQTPLVSKVELQFNIEHRTSTKPPPRK
jgi:hypothetical protein